MGRLLSIQEVLSDRLPIARTSLHKLMSSGELRTVKIGGRRFIRECDLDEFIDRHVVGGGAE